MQNKLPLFNTTNKKKNDESELFSSMKEHDEKLGVNKVPRPHNNSRTTKSVKNMSQRGSVMDKNSAPGDFDYEDENDQLIFKEV